MEIFRDHGYAGTSTQMLVEGLGINRFSLYAEFGNKQALFEAALERYNKEVVDRNFGPLDNPEAGITQIRALLEFFASAGRGTAWGRGCLLCNTAVEFGPKDLTGSGFVQQYFAHLSKAFSTALQNAQNKGELRGSAAIQEEADFFTASILGLFVMLRAKTPAKFLENAARAAINHLEELRANKAT